MADPARVADGRIKQTAEDAGAAAAAVDNLKGKLEGLNGVQVKAPNEGLAKIADTAKSKIPAAMNAAKDAIVGVGTAVKKVLAGDVRGALDMVGGAIKGGVESATKKLTDVLEKLGPAGAVAAAVISTAVAIATAGVSALVGSLLDAMAAAIGMAEGGARIKATFAALAGGKEAGAAVLKMVSELSAKMPFATGQIRGWAQELLAAGIKGEKLKSAIEAVAAAQALMGDAGAASATNLLKQLGEGGAAADTLVKGLKEGSKKAAAALAEMGLQTKDLADALGMTPEAFAKAKLSADQMSEAVEKALKKKGAGPLEEMMGSWPVILMKVKAGIQSLFGDAGAAVKPFMAEVKKLFENFYKGGAIINMLKPIVTAVLTTAFEWATRAVKAIRGIIEAFMDSTKAGGVLSGAITALKAGWAVLVQMFGLVGSVLKPIWTALKTIFSNAMVLQGLKYIFAGIAAAIMVVVVVIASVIAAFAAVAGAVAGAVGLIVGGIASVIGQITSMGETVIGVLGWLIGGAKQVGSDMISGLVSAITGGISAAVGAVVDLVSGVINAARGAADAHSPSRKMIGLVGKPLGQGVSVGMTAENDNARAAGEKSVASAIGGASKAADGGLGALAAPTPAKGGGAPAGAGIHIGSLTIMQPPGATRKEGEDFAEGFTKKMRELAAEAA